MTPTPLELAIEGGKIRADRDRLLRLVLAVEEGFTDGTATLHWRALLRIAHWMRDRDEGVPS